MPISCLRDLLPKAINRAGITRQFAATGVCQLFRRIISKKNKKAVENCKPLYYRNHVLYVKCKSSAWANELQMQSYVIIEEINERLRKKVVERIAFKV